MSVWSDKPLIGGDTDKQYFDNLIDKNLIKTGVNLIGAGILLLPNNSGWFNKNTYNNFKGYIGAIATTRLVTNIVKNAIGRKRPSFDNYPSNKISDSRKSFFSGHSSQAFSVATYVSLYVLNNFGESNNYYHNVGKYSVITGFYSLASIIAYSRIKDNKHFLSDVIVGGCIGTAVSYLVYKYKNGHLENRNYSITVNGTNITLSLAM